MKLENKLQDWTASGLISEDQAGAIRAYEQKGASTNWAIYTIAGLGIVVLTTGVVSVVAANWYEIPAALKLLLYFLLQIGLGAAFYTAQPGLRRETALTAFALFILSGIGLIAQIYNLRGDGWQALLLWLILITPITLLAESRLINHIWVIGLTVTLFVWLSATSHGMDVQIAIALVVPFLCLALGLLRPNPFPERFAAANMQWALIALLWFVTPWINVCWAAGGAAPHGVGDWAFLPLLGGVLAAAAVLVNWQARNKSAAVCAAAAIAVVAVGEYFIVRGLYEHKPLVGCLFFVAIWALAGAAAGFAGRRRLFETAAVVLALRVIIVYFEVFKSLAATGVGLVISGLVIVGVAFLWQTLRRRALAWMGGRHE